MARTFLLLAAVLAALTGTVSAASAADILSELQTCRGLSDAERLVCFDRILARHDPAGASAAPVVPTAPLAAAPVAAPVAAATPAAPPPSAVTKANPAADFGAEGLAQSAPEPAPAEVSLVAKVTTVSLNAFKGFTITLDNGQVWRQLDSDTAVARFGAANTVKITRGFLGGYSLSIEGGWGTYKVKRIK